MLYLNKRSLIALAIALIALPAIAKDSNFPKFSLNANQKTAIVEGSTGGSYSLSSIANQDKNKNPCLGYGDTTPDHIMTLEQDFSKLKLEVNSSVQDTTLIVRGPDQNTIRCGLSNGDNKGAIIEDNNLFSKGEYEIWVGSSEAAQIANYTLSAQAE
jgi:hypothetical protein